MKKIFSVFAILTIMASTFAFAAVSNAEARGWGGRHHRGFGRGFGGFGFNRIFLGGGCGGFNNCGCGGFDFNDCGGCGGGCGNWF